MKIKIATYNIHRCIGLDRRFKPDRIANILNDINADIVLLQEVDEGVPRSNKLNLATELANSCGYQHYVLGHNVTLKTGQYGNATLSRFPIISDKNINLTIGDKKNRGCQHTKIKLHKTKIDVFNLHLGLSATERQKQAGIILHSKQFKKLKASEACIVAGDFNDWRSLLRALFIEGFNFACATDNTKLWGESAIKTFPSFAPRGGLDRVYYKGKVKLLRAASYRQNITMVASDHLPIVAEFEV
ncbi:MAG: endonuclease/exonuclease/phosphatase family protein [Proteobacteria bacterium]|nr:endonuclease/exonuclease/phosphatase family protein [Pseudomonadota bacterium]